MSFEANVRTTDNVAILELHGEIAGSAEETLIAAHDEAVAGRPAVVVLNFDDVSYINSTGIALIVGLLADARKAGRTLSACGLSDHYKEIFEITRIADFVSVFDDEQSAVGAAKH